MCYSKDYRAFEQKKAVETKLQQERRAGVIDKMLDEANKEAEQPQDATPIKDVAPAK